MVARGRGPEGDLALRLHESFVYEDGVFRVEPPDSAGHIHEAAGTGFAQLSVLAETAAATSYVCAFRGLDPITELWHQCVWIFLMVDGKVARAIRTVSRSLDATPHDGKLDRR